VIRSFRTRKPEIVATARYCRDKGQLLPVKIETPGNPDGEYVVGKVQTLTAEPQEHADQFVIVLEVPDDPKVHDALKRQAKKRDARRPAILVGRSQ
jgi:hypothetical protein